MDGLSSGANAMTTENWVDKYIPANACPEAVKWAHTQPSLMAAWQQCQCGDWMIWWLVRTARPGSKRHRRAILCLCEHIRPLLKQVPADEQRPRQTLDLVERWANGDRVTKKQPIELNWLEVRGPYAAYLASAVYLANAAYRAYAADAAVNAAYVADAGGNTDDLAGLIRKYFPDPLEDRP